MRRPSIHQGTYFLIVFILFTAPNTIAGDATIPMADVQIPVYSGGFDVTRRLADSLMISYRIALAYPAPELVAFYNGYFNRNGWIPSFETCQQRWYRNTPGNEWDASFLRELFASWEHPGLNLRAALRLSHQKQAGIWEDTIHVQARIDAQKHVDAD